MWKLSNRDRQDNASRGHGFRGFPQLRRHHRAVVALEGSTISWWTRLRMRAGIPQEHANTLKRLVAKRKPVAPQVVL
jgi:hypothetical protein